jgi:Na+-translocating ferredoxin:NAD+ oxidoreductase RnfC subunit
LQERKNFAFPSEISLQFVHPSFLERSNMSISSISSATSATASSSNTTSQLEKEKQDLLKQLADEQASKDDDKVKQLKAAELQRQIDAIEAAIEAANKAKANKDVAPAAAAAQDADLTSLVEKGNSSIGLNKVV